MRDEESMALSQGALVLADNDEPRHEIIREGGEMIGNQWRQVMNKTIE